MEYQISAETDRGAEKKVNQDSCCWKQALYGGAPILLAAVCDGMGGLSSGELASAEAVRTLGNWFSSKLPSFLKEPREDQIYESLEREIQLLNLRTAEYGRRQGISLGTTLTVFLCIGARYLIFHIGDTRVYRLRSGALSQLTKDQSYVQREIDSGRMGEAERETSPKRNILLQCVGASRSVVPEKLSGEVEPGDVFLLCSDGFRHELTHREIEEHLKAGAQEPHEEMRKRLREMVGLAKQRGEQDDISVIAVQSR